jgi:succinyldiaminopimelate transaminase
VKKTTRARRAKAAPKRAPVKARAAKKPTAKKPTPRPTARAKAPTTKSAAGRAASPRFAAPIAPPLHPMLTGAREYPFVTLDRMKARLVPAGLEPINFGMGDPRELTPEFIKQTLRDSIPPMSSYPLAAGQPALRQACAGWMQRRFGVALDPDRHILPVNGSKEAVFLMALAMVDRDARRRKDIVIIPSPCYPVYESGAVFAGATPYFVPLRSEDEWRFVPERVPARVWERAALLWLTTPHNPTGSVSPPELTGRVLATARRHGTWVASDEAYSEIWFDRAPGTTLQLGLENVVVLHTLSKRSAMTGFRSGFMAGDPRLIEALRRFRPNVGNATPDFVQAAAIAAWNDDAHPEEQRARYAEKRAIVLGHFRARGWTVEASEATFYLWLKAPGGDDVAFVEALLRAGLVCMPGSFMGRGGEGFVRFALVPTVEQCREAVRRLAGVRG